MSDIINAVEAATGQPFNPSPFQRDAMERGKDAAGVVANIPRQLATLQEIVANGYGVDAKAIPAHFLTGSLDLENPTARARPNNFKTIVETIHSTNKIELGRLLERMRNPITGIYLRVFDRMPDEAGFDFWNGVPLRDPEYSFGQIERDMRAAKAQGAK